MLAKLWTVQVIRPTLTALALDLDEYGEIGGSLAIPRRERLEKLETLRLRVNCNLDGGTVLGRGLERVLTGVVSTRRELKARRVGELEGLAVGTGEGVRERVEPEITSKCHSGDDVGGSDESVGGRVGIIAAGEVAVV